MHRKYVQSCKAKKQVHIHSPIPNSSNLFKCIANCGVILLDKMGKIELLAVNALCQVQNILVFSSRYSGLHDLLATTGNELPWRWSGTAKHTSETTNNGVSRLLR